MSPRQPTEMPLLAFFYGSLMRDYWNWPVFCSHATAIGKGFVPGRLWLRHTGTPILEPGKESVLHKGTADVAADLALQQQISTPEAFAQLVKSHLLANEVFLSQISQQELEAEFVLGQWMLFENGAETLRDLDRLEEFTPKKPEDSLYERFLLRSPALRLPVWVYAIPAEKDPTSFRKPSNPHHWNPSEEGVPRDPKTGVFLAF